MPYHCVLGQLYSGGSRILPLLWRNPQLGKGMSYLLHFSSTPATDLFDLQPYPSVSEMELALKPLLRTRRMVQRIWS
jgi:hypothetical protein